MIWSNLSVKRRILIKWPTCSRWRKILNLFLSRSSSSERWGRMQRIAMWKLGPQTAMRELASEWYSNRWTIVYKHTKSRTSHRQRTSVTCTLRNRCLRKVQKVTSKALASHLYPRVMSKVSTRSPTSLKKKTTIFPQTYTSIHWWYQDQGLNKTNQS